MDLILMIDTSGSMSGQKIASVYDSIENLMESLCGYNNLVEPVNCCVQLYSRDVRWLYDTMISVKDFKWSLPECTGMTSMGEACSTLAAFIESNNIGDNLKILIITDGCPTDDFEEGMDKLQKTKGFVSADKFALAIGEEADIASLLSFTGDESKIYRPNTIEDLFDSIINGENVWPDNNAQPVDTSIPTETDDEWE